MRIAYFSEVYWPMVSGVSNTLRRTVDWLDRHGHAVRVYAPTYPLPAGTSDRPEVRRSPSRALVLDRAVQWARPKHGEIIADLRAFRPDVVHVLTEFAMGNAGVRAATGLGIPLVASAHTDYERYAPLYHLGWLMGAGWRYLRWFYRHARIVLAPSSTYESRLHARGVWHTGIWSRGVDTAEFSPTYRSESFRRSLGVESHDVLVACVTRLAPEKGIPRLLEAWDRLGDRRRGATLVLVGTGLLEETLRRDAPEGVRLTGLLRGRELATAYASADLFAFPSSTETFGNVLLEAMASGLPAVAMAAGGLTDFAQDGTNALLADPVEPEAFADRLARLIADPALRATLAQGALDTGTARRWDRVFAGLLETYEAVAPSLARAA